MFVHFTALSCRYRFIPPGVMCLMEAGLLAWGYGVCQTFCLPSRMTGQWLAVTGSRPNLPLQLREQLPTISSCFNMRQKPVHGIPFQAACAAPSICSSVYSSNKRAWCQYGKSRAGEMFLRLNLPYRAAITLSPARIALGIIEVSPGRIIYSNSGVTTRPGVTGMP